MNAAIHGGWRSFSKEKGPNGGGRRCCDERRVIFSRAYTSDCPGCIAANSIRDEPLTTKCFVSVADDSTEVDKANFSWMNVHIFIPLARHHARVDAALIRHRRMRSSVR